MNNKRYIFKITEDYVNRYSIDSSFVGKKIVIYDDRYDHIEKHRSEFSDNHYLDLIIRDLPMIVSNPDYIHIDRLSMQIIKQLNDNVLVVVRVSSSSELKIKTLYPISEAKFNRLKKER